MTDDRLHLRLQSHRKTSVGAAGCLAGGIPIAYG